MVTPVLNRKKHTKWPSGKRIEKGSGMTSFLWAWNMTKNSTLVSILQSRNDSYHALSTPILSPYLLQNQVRPPASSISRYRVRHRTIEAGSTQVSGEKVCSHLFPKKDLATKWEILEFPESIRICSLALSPHVLAHPSDPWSICRLLAITSPSHAMRLHESSHLFYQASQAPVFVHPLASLFPSEGSGSSASDTFHHLLRKLDKSWHSPKHIKAAKPKLSPWKNDQRMRHSSSPDEKDMEPGEMSAPVEHADTEFLYYLGPCS